jgi:hypothetical protein
MELSGNLWERVVTLGNATGRTFSGVHGNGTLTSSGEADVSGWPAAAGTGWKGGAYDAAAIVATASDRNQAANGNNSRAANAGGRGVRTISSGIVTNGLVLWLDAGIAPSYAGSGTTWTDISGNRNNGTLTNGPTYNSSNGGSIVFDGVNDYVVTSTSSFSGALTFSFWINGNIKDGVDHVFISLGNSDWSNSIGIMNYGNNLTYFGENSGFVTLDPSSTIMTANWINVVITQSSSFNATITSYLNGVFGTQGSLQYPITLSNLSRYIGMRYDSAHSFGGKIAQVSIYNRALSAAEVAQNFNALKSRFGL